MADCPAMPRCPHHFQLGVLLVSEHLVGAVILTWAETLQNIQTWCEHAPAWC